MSPVGPPPERDKLDRAQDLLEIYAAGIPIVGGALQRAIVAGLKTSHDRRMDVWRTRLAATVDELEAANASFDFDALRQNEDFISHFIHLTRVALATHLEEKIDLLQAALVQIATGNTDRLTTAYIRFIEDLEPADVAVLGAMARHRSGDADHKKALLDELCEEGGLDPEAIEFSTGFLQSARLIGMSTVYDFDRTNVLPLGSAFLAWLKIL